MVGALITARASLLWNPVPKFAKSSVWYQGPRITLAFTFGRDFVTLPFRSSPVVLTLECTL